MIFKGQDSLPLRLEQLQTIKDHKYSCRGSSLFEKYFQVFWCGLVSYIPTWIAPNTLTLTGLVMNVTSSLILLSYSPDLRSEVIICTQITVKVPTWSLVFAALCVFIYQTLDALDGKQARRTNTASPLGELFDHGCDAIATSLLTLLITLTHRHQFSFHYPSALPSALEVTHSLSSASFSHLWPYFIWHTGNVT